MVTALPTGLVSFLFTDVEGSTRLWESDPEGMSASLARHDEILRAAVVGRGGHIFSTAGDAFAVAFHSCEDAVDAAVEVQLGLHAAEWPGPEVRVRMGVHTGTAEERDGDYFGPTMNRAARIMAAGHGGQVLVSAVAAQHLSSDWRLDDLGTHHLRDLDEPEHLFRLFHDGLPVVDAPIRTVDIRRHNLPDYLTSFIGRVSELAEFETLMAGTRLAVLTGVGGTGKTRLAVEAARRHIDELPDGAWLIELAPITNPALIMTEIGNTWDLRPGEGATIEDVVIRYLWSREVLLVVDNCEHLLDGAAAAIKQILDACPGVRIVATSRESLGIPGETMLRVPSLGLPDATHDVEASEAVLLFLDRARLAKDDFTPDVDEWSAIRRIVTRIDGIPLGLELAAARLRSMSPAELADRLEDSFRILSGSSKTALPRQRTLAATIDWSHDLLKPAERALFQRLSVFVGGFDLAAAEAVCPGGELEEWEVLDHLDSLIDKSLVTLMAESGDRTRYRLLEPVRQYAQEQFSQTGDVGDFQLAHAYHYAGVVAEASPQLRGPERLAWMDLLERDYDNIRAAFTTLLEAGDCETYLTMTFDLFMHWVHTGLHLEAIDTALAGLGAVSEQVDPVLQVKVWFTTATIAAEITRPEGVEYGRAGLDVARTVDDPNLLGRAELALGAAIRHATTDPEYLGHLLEARRLLEANPEPHWWEPRWEFAFHSLMLAGYLPGRDERKQEHSHNAVEAFAEVGDRAMYAVSLADSAGLLGQVDEGWIVGNLEQAAEIFEDDRSPYWYAHTLYYMGIIHSLAGRHADAATALARATARLRDSGDVSCWAGASRFLAQSESELGEHAQAKQRIADVIDSTPILPMQEVAKPRALDSAAAVLAASGMYEQAAKTLGRAAATELDIDSILPRDEILAAVRDRLTDQLGAEQVERLMAIGAGVDIDDMLGSIRGWMDP